MTGPQPRSGGTAQLPRYKSLNSGFIKFVTTLKRQATKILAELHDTKETVLITEHGKPSAYLVDAEAYEMMENRMRIPEGTAMGERAVLGNRVVKRSEARKKMKKWLD